jgi:colanic acid biosynthesis glycosyl transferase WcaI
MTAARSVDLSGRHVALVSIFFPPDTTGVAPYAGQVARFLRDAGARVTVITGVPHYPQWLVKPEYRWVLRARENRDGIQVIRLRHFVPRRHSAVGRVAYEATFLLNGGTLRFGPAPDAFIAMTPSLAGAAFAMHAARRARKPFGLVVQDLMGNAAAESGIGAGRAVAAITRRMERRVLAAAQLVGVISGGIQDAVVGLGVEPDRVRLLPNWVHVPVASVDRAARRRVLGWPAERRVILHSGNMGFKQDLDNLVQAARLAEATHPDLLFVLLGDGNQRAGLESRAVGLPNLRFQDPVDDAAYPDTLLAADVLVVNERATVREMSLPSKLTSYFASGRPVVAAVHPAGATAREIERARAGVLVEPGDPHALVAAVEFVARDEAKMEAMGAAGRAHAKEHLSADAARHRYIEFAEDLMVAPPLNPARGVGQATKRALGQGIND